MTIRAATRPCTECRTAVIFVRTWSLDDKPRPSATVCLNPEPYPRNDTRANYAVCGSGYPKARMLKHGEELLAEEDRYMPHAATCIGRRSTPTPIAQQQLLSAPEPTQPPAAPTKPTLENLLAELDNLVGLAAVKTTIRRQINLTRMNKLRAQAGLNTPGITRHLVFTGNPGTGKTTVARLIAGIYRALGVLSKGHLVEVPDRSILIGEYIGTTATKTRDVLDTGLGGVVFIDEAYNLTSSDSRKDYGREAVDTLVAWMENNRDDVVVIVAGYPEPMADFIASNPGLASRFRTTVHFADYTDAELVTVFERLAAAADYTPTNECLMAILDRLAATPRGVDFGNGRWARNLLDYAIERQADRVLRDFTDPTIDQMRELTAEDIR